MARANRVGGRTVIGSHPFAFILGSVLGAALVTVAVFFVVRGPQNLTLSWPWSGSGAGGETSVVSADYEEVAQAASSRGAASVEVVSCDVSAYPTVRLYLRILDGSGGTVRLGSTQVSLLEGVAGQGQLRREVVSLLQLEGRQGVSYDLVVDKSGSMESDIGRVKAMLSDFVNSLDYAAGDQAELLSFDSFVMYLCTHTSDAQLLRGGIANMEAWGDTALYDALCEGIANAAARGGARCVICFTDGQDNRSTRTAADVVAQATATSVPVFIIGTGDVDRAALEDIARRTGGSYWDIADVGDLASILSGIMATEQDLYCLEYTSDAAVEAGTQRSISLALADEESGAELHAEVAPTAEATYGHHEHRYELVRADVSWTQANAECIARGGHLVTITSQAEMDTITSMADAEGVRFVWMGGYTSVRDGTPFGHWVTGEAFDFAVWYPNEPSRTDRDGTPEMYLILWRPQADGPWSWNDERDAPQLDSLATVMLGKMGYVCEYEDAAA